VVEVAVAAVEPMPLLFGMTEERVDLVFLVKDIKVVLDGEITVQDSLVMVGLAAEAAAQVELVVMHPTILMAVVKAVLVSP
jgi:hypothetical protein